MRESDAFKSTCCDRQNSMREGGREAGWLTEEAWSAIKVQLHVRFQTLMRTASSPVGGHVSIPLDRWTPLLLPRCILRFLFLPLLRHDDHHQPPAPLPHVPSSLPFSSSLTTLLTPLSLSPRPTPLPAPPIIASLLIPPLGAPFPPLPPPPLLAVTTATVPRPVSYARPARRKKSRAPAFSQRPGYCMRVFWTRTRHKNSMNK